MLKYRSISNYNGITTFTELLNFTGKICLFFINKELYFFSQLLKYYMLHGLIYSFLWIWDFKNKWEMLNVSFHPSDIGKQLGLLWSYPNRSRRAVF